MPKISIWIYKKCSIEKVLKETRLKNEEYLSVFFEKVIAVLFGGIGTTLLFQNDLFPRFLNKIVEKYSESQISILLSVVGYVCVFLIICIVYFLLFKFIDHRSKTRDNKRTAEDRELLAEYFHKVFINEIIMGTSFTQKADRKFASMIKGDKTNSEKVKIMHDCCMYISQAQFYLKMAKEDVVKIGIGKHQIEHDSTTVYSKRYEMFVKIVGNLALVESVQMLRETIEALEKVIEKIMRFQEENDIVQREIYIITKQSAEDIASLKEFVLNREYNVLSSI